MDELVQFSIKHNLVIEVHPYKNGVALFVKKNTFQSSRFFSQSALNDPVFGISAYLRLLEKQLFQWFQTNPKNTTGGI